MKSKQVSFIENFIKKEICYNKCKIEFNFCRVYRSYIFFVRGRLRTNFLVNKFYIPRNED